MAGQRNVLIPVPSGQPCLFCHAYLRAGMDWSNDMTKKIYDKQSKKWYAVSDDCFKTYDRMCNTTRKRMQDHGRCWCSKKKHWLCDMNCTDCEFQIVLTKSLDEPIMNNDEASSGTLLDIVEDTNAIAEKIVADRDLLQYLFTRLQKLDPEAEKLFAIWREHPEGISDRKVAKLLGRPQRTFAYEMKRFRGV